jgi:hypothetical protein
VLFVGWLRGMVAERHNGSRKAAQGLKLGMSILSFIGMSIPDSAGSM